MGRRESNVPEPICSAITELWNVSSDTEEGAFYSGAFRLLEVNCGSAYSEIKGSRLYRKQTVDTTQREVRSALQNFFRWNGAPWYEGCSPGADETALKLHQAFLSMEVNRNLPCSVGSTLLGRPFISFSSNRQEYSFRPERDFAP